MQAQGLPANWSLLEDDEAVREVVLFQGPKRLQANLANTTERSAIGARSVSRLVRSVDIGGDAAGRSPGIPAAGVANWIEDRLEQRDQAVARLAFSTASIWAWL